MSSTRSEIGIGRRILIVDDEPAQCESLRDLILLYGYEVEIAMSGEEAIKVMGNCHFDILLLDLNMPGMTGFDVIDHIIENRIAAKVVVISGEVCFESVKQALQKGAHDFIKKPYVPDELLATIENAVSKKALEDTNTVISQKLSESEYLHRFIVDNSPDIVFMLDTEGRFTFLNETIYQLLGYNKNELIGEHYSKIIARQSKDQAKHIFTERRSGMRKAENIELKLKCRDESEYRYFDTSTMSMMLNQNNFHDTGNFEGTKRCHGKEAR